MTVLDTAVFIFVAYGVTYGFVESALLWPIRAFLLERADPSLSEGKADVWVFFTQLIYCAYCTGFWAGAAIAVFLAGFGLADFAHAVVWPLFVPGTIALIRAFAPDFLQGDFGRERSIVQEASGPAGDESEASGARSASNGDRAPGDHGPGHEW